MASAADDLVQLAAAGRASANRPDGAVAVLVDPLAESAAAAQGRTRAVRGHDEIERPVPALLHVFQPDSAALNVAAADLVVEMDPHVFCQHPLVQDGEQVTAVQSDGASPVAQFGVRQMDEGLAPVGDGVQGVDGLAEGGHAVEQSQLAQDELPGRLQEDTGADGPDLRRSLEDLDVMAIACQELRDGGAADAEADHADTVAPHNGRSP